MILFIGDASAGMVESDKYIPTSELPMYVIPKDNEKKLLSIFKQFSVECFVKKDVAEFSSYHYRHGLSDLKFPFWYDIQTGKKTLMDDTWVLDNKGNYRCAASFCDDMKCPINLVKGFCSIHTCTCLHHPFADGEIKFYRIYTCLGSQMGNIFTLRQIIHELSDFDRSYLAALRCLDHLSRNGVDACDLFAIEDAMRHLKRHNSDLIKSWSR
jgi:hypothetical protein